MAIAKMPGISWKTQKSEVSRLAWAFAISIALHLLVIGTYEGGKRWGWWQNWHWPKWMQSVKMISELLKPKPSSPPPPPAEPPLMFVEVNPEQAAAEPPKDSKFYSDKNSKAANPDPTVEANVPKIEGKQTDMVKTEDVPRTKAFPLQPTPPKTETAKEAQEEEKPKPAQPIGDLAMAKPVTNSPTPQKEAGEAQKPRPRTIKEAMARQPNSPMAGQKMKQEGGVPNHALKSSLDVTSSLFGAYDAAIIAAIQNRWYSLLDQRNFTYDRSGRVTLRFRLHADGTVSQIEFMGNDVGAALGLLCQSAIKDPSPFAPWPSDMRRKIGVEYREVTFTFLYY